MKKKLSVGLLTASMVTAMLSACGSASVSDTGVTEAENTTQAAAEEGAEAADNITVVVDCQEETPEDAADIITEEYDSYLYGTSGAIETISYRYLEKEDMPYYVAADEANPGSSYLASIEGNYDRILYLDLPLNVATTWSDRKVDMVAVEDSDIIEYDASTNELIGRKQGLTTVVLTYEDGTTESEKIAVTTYNDGKTEEKVKTDFTFAIENNGNVMDNPELFREGVNTISDVFCYIIYNEYIGGEYEPARLPFCSDDNCINNSAWQWMVPGSSVLDYSGGVCIETAQMASYLLADNFEDWGYIEISGSNGHIFNWFYEDGIYYAVDFTYAAAEGGRQSLFVYQNEIYACSSIDDLTNWVKSKENYCSPDTTVCVWMMGCLGHDYMSAHVNGIMNMGVDETRGTDKEVRYCFEDLVYEDSTFHWIYKNPDFNITEMSVSSEDLPNKVKFSDDACYGVEVINHSYNYSNDRNL